MDFTVDGVTETTDANGQACFDGLLPGDYTVHEVTPAGYNGEADKTITVNNQASRPDDPFMGGRVSFQNTPLSNPCGATRRHSPLNRADPYGAGGPR